MVCWFVAVGVVAIAMTWMPAIREGVYKMRKNDKEAVYTELTLEA
jgi:hypothetical protein